MEPIWAKIGQNLHVKKNLSASGTGPPPYLRCRIRVPTPPWLKSRTFTSRAATRERKPRYPNRSEVGAVFRVDSADKATARDEDA